MDFLSAFWSLMFPGAPLSSDAEGRIKGLFEMANAGSDMDEHFYEDILGILIEDQSKQGLRVHKGYPLYWIARKVGTSDKEKALRFMLEAFVEDVLTHGHDALPGFAATSLRKDFGLSTKTLVALKDLVIEKVKGTFYPSSLVSEFSNMHRGEIKTKETFEGVTDESRYDSIVEQVKSKLSADLRPSMTNDPGEEADVQNVIFALLRQIDPLTDSETTITKLAGKEFKVDFSMAEGKVGVEAKLIKQKGDRGSIIDQINADIPAYVQSFKKVMFVVYDACGAISDVSKFVAELERARSEIEILVIKH